jgi:hypothetical protein
MEERERLAESEEIVRRDSAGDRVAIQEGLGFVQRDVVELGLDCRDVRRRLAGPMVAPGPCRVEIGHQVG